MKTLQPIKNLGERPHPAAYRLSHQRLPQLLFADTERFFEQLAQGQDPSGDGLAERPEPLDLEGWEAWWLPTGTPTAIGETFGAIALRRADLHAVPRYLVVEPTVTGQVSVNEWRLTARVRGPTMDAKASVVQGYLSRFITEEPHPAVEYGDRLQTFATVEPAWFESRPAQRRSEVLQENEARSGLIIRRNVAFGCIALLCATMLIGVVFAMVQKDFTDRERQERRAEQRLRADQARASAHRSATPAEPKWDVTDCGCALAQIGQLPGHRCGTVRKQLNSKPLTSSMAEQARRKKVWELMAAITEARASSTLPACVGAQPKD